MYIVYEHFDATSETILHSFIVISLDIPNARQHFQKELFTNPFAPTYIVEKSGSPVSCVLYACDRRKKSWLIQSLSYVHSYTWWGLVRVCKIPPRLLYMLFLLRWTDRMPKMPQDSCFWTEMHVLWGVEGGRAGSQIKTAMCDTARETAMPPSINYCVCFVLGSSALHCVQNAPCLIVLSHSLLNNNTQICNLNEHISDEVVHTCLQLLYLADIAIILHCLFNVIWVWEVFQINFVQH